MTVSERGNRLYSETGRRTDISHHRVFSARERVRQEDTSRLNKAGQQGHRADDLPDTA